MMKTIAAVFQLCLLSLAFQLNAQAQQLKGRIVDLDGNGIPGATVTAALRCTPPPGLPVPIGNGGPFTLSNSTQSSTDGSFDVYFPFPIPGGSSCGTREYFWSASKPGFTFSSIASNSSPPDQAILIKGTNVPTWISLSAASYANFPLLTSSSISAGFGSELSTETDSALATPLPFVLAGRNVTITDSAGIERLAPLLFVSPTQVNYLLPTGLANGVATVRLKAGSTLLRAGFVQITPVSPGIFTANANGKGVAAAVIVRVRANNQQSYEPVARYDETQKRFVALPIEFGPEPDFLVLALFGTGWRNLGAENTVVYAWQGDLRFDCPVEYIGPQPTLAGLDQINVRLPRTLIGKGIVTVSVHALATGHSSNAVELNFK